MAETIGDRIRRWRKLRGISVRTLSAKIGLAASTIYDLERGDSTSSTELPSIARALRINVHYLESGHGDPESGAPTDDEILSARGWPFRVALSRYERLSERERLMIDSVVEHLITHCEASPQKRAKKRRTA